MNTIENKIEVTLNVLDTLQSVEVPLALKHSIKNGFKKKEIRMSAAQKWMIAASVIVLIGLNLVSVLKYSKNKSIATNELKSKNIIYVEYFSTESE